jgi:hypothetical protein
LQLSYRFNDLLPDALPLDITLRQQIIGTLSSHKRSVEAVLLHEQVSGPPNVNVSDHLGSPRVYTILFDTVQISVLQYIYRRQYAIGRRQPRDM